ncbi:type IV secretion system DNA-binding domain-containing protein [Marmoricola sp. URHB0036]|uniref:type IV secretion system DNA-binding domain-containing protein n=1 Tax=Marmoricola sp. URHB0036 TaxID=1298863 RepID=UPI0003FD8965|nr:type IV secretion system DNA-binding domain-containing protein [Marmoricola sp. URHB0036]
MLLLILTTMAGAVVTAVLVGFRQWEGAAWRRQLVGFRLRLPTGLTSEQIAGWLASIAALTHAPRGVLLPSPPVVIEVRGTAMGVEYQLLVPRPLRGAVLSSLAASLPAVRVEPDEARGLTMAGVRLAAGLRLAGRHRQLAIERADLSSRTLAAALQPLRNGESIAWQWIISGSGTPPPVRTGDSTATGLPWWLEEQAPADADGLRAARLKQRQPLLNATARLVVEAPTRSRARSLFGRAWGGVRLTSVPGSRLVRDYWSATVTQWQVAHRWVPSLSWPLRLNAAELAGLMPWPVGDEPLAGQPMSITRQVPPPVNLPVKGTVLADATYPGQSRPIRLAERDRLMHVSLLGPTGTGKSTLMVNMALQDIEAGNGLALIDPKADMARDLLDLIPPRHQDKVVVLNPADLNRPVGFNPLQTSGGEQARELAVDHVLHVFREVWAGFWGPRTDAVLRSALLTLSAASANDGSAFTLCELPKLLSDDAFRRWLTANPALPESVREFWDWFDRLKPAERVQVVGPVMNKLSALTQRTSLRLILGQSQGLDLTRIIAEGKILLLPLSRGLIGSETAALLSSLMLASIWQAVLGRVRVAKDARRPFWLYIDEASEVVRLPLDLSDVMAEARGFATGLTLATQHLAQLPQDVRRALLATVRSQIVFQVEADDARVLARSFSPTLDETDLRSLPAYEVAMRLSIDGHTSRPITGRTRPMPTTDAAVGDRLKAISRNAYGVSRRDVEAALHARGRAPGGHDRPVGRRPARGSS